MNTFTGIFIVLAIFMMNACNLKVESEVDKPKESNWKVLAIHELNMKPGVDEKEFETFVMTEIAPLYRQIKGQDLFLVKGDAGVRTGEYAIFITFASLEELKSTYLPDGSFSEEFEKVLEGTDELWDRFQLMADGFDGKEFTNYVKAGE